MDKQNNSKTIRVSLKVYNFINKKVRKASETFDDILKRLLKIK